VECNQAKPNQNNKSLDNKTETPAKFS
jgi:hypothetical protein